MSSVDVLERVRSIHGEAIAVVGDLMLDRFVWGKVSRISPEAPVPVVEIERESFHLGGAANVARNLASLGATPLLLGVVGDDDASSQLRQTLRDRALSDDTVLTDATRRTTVKTRIIAGSQQVVRADWESVDDLSGEVESRALDALDDIIGRARAVVLSDYAKGTLTPRIIERAIERAHQHDLPILVDPKLRRYRLYQGVTLVTPNLHEATRFAGIAVVTDNDIAQAAETILNDLSCTAVLITRGEQGMTLFETGASPHHIETFAREVFDVSGAGDTVIAAAALALAAGATLAEAAELANRAAGVVVGKLGTATVELEEL
jgi:D-beta-D-heptose 7-phosphate kinase/D-beta-D-heptose 1-phosphate adenosyltransferase